jgi:meso-butanediol dehydrogenase / (S,S)-butanediol dehydrogenase / diacetyl reductase
MAARGGKVVTGKVAFITGGSRGIGYAIGERLSAEGYKIAIYDREPPALVPEGWLYLNGDVADPEAMEKAVAACEDRLGPLTFLVSNAGICPIDAIVDMPVADFQTVFRVNVEGAFICLRTVLPRMIARKAGSVVVMSSWIGRNGQPYYGAYAATKAALIALTQSAANEVAPHGIRVNAVCPGIVDRTEMRASIDAAHAGAGRPDLSQRLKTVPMGRAAEPEDIVGIVAFLASDDARYITGEALGVTGGVR